MLMDKILEFNIIKSYVLALTIVASVIFSAPQYISSAQSTSQPLASHTMSLTNRFPNSEYVSDVMADNILLTLAYLNGQKESKNIDWQRIAELKKVEFTLNPGETFAFHNDTLSKYSAVIKTTNSTFNSGQGFKSDGYLIGDGVCHLASLLYWVAKDAQLETFVPKDHNFAVIPEVPKEFGVSIFYTPGSKEMNANRNLYIKNTLDKPVNFTFTVEGTNLEIAASKVN